MSQINRSGNSRVLGTSIGRMPTSAGNLYTRGQTPEQKAQRERETQASYEVWRKEREARKAQRFDALRARNLGR